jgi:hypothetical protein
MQQLAPHENPQASASTALRHHAHLCTYTTKTPCNSCWTALSFQPLQESAVVRYQPVSLPHRPAHLVAVNDSRKQLLLVVRGTSQLADVLTDLVAHTSALGPGGRCRLKGLCHTSVIRQKSNTCTWRVQADVLADLVAHTFPLRPGGSSSLKGTNHLKVYNQTPGTCCVYMVELEHSMRWRSVVFACKR